MSGVLVVVVCALAGAMALFGVVTAALDRRVGRPQLAGVGVVELAVLVLAVAGIVGLVHGPRPQETATTVVYLLVLPFLLPAATLWTLAERSRASTLVLVVACLAVAVMVFRVWLLWQVTV